MDNRAPRRLAAASRGRGPGRRAQARSPYRHLRYAHQNHTIQAAVIQYCGQIAKLAERRCRSRRLPEPPSVIPDDAIMRRQPLEKRQPYRRVAPTRIVSAANGVGPRSRDVRAAPVGHPRDWPARRVRARRGQGRSRASTQREDHEDSVGVSTSGQSRVFIRRRTAAHRRCRTSRR